MRHLHITMALLLIFALTACDDEGESGNNSNNTNNTNNTSNSTCGDGVAQPEAGEECDGEDLAGATCESLGQPAGALNCDTTCHLDTTACGGPECSENSDCDDQIQCTVDTCDAGTCVNLPVHGECDNGFFCDGEELCDPEAGDPVTGCLPGEEVVCDDGVDCTLDSCDEALGGCFFLPSDDLCPCGHTCDATGGCMGPPQAQCQNQTYECGDGIDNDGDCLIDMEDPDCLGPCDNSESGFYMNQPGDTAGPCNADCYFDNGTGSGNDDCHWDYQCDPLETSPDYYPAGDSCAYDPSTQPTPGITCGEAMNIQSALCLDICVPLTPNGCDCFGCCDLPGVAYSVFLGSKDSNNNGTCDLTNAAVPSLCQPCTIVTACFNECEECELCVGKHEVPPSCATGHTCPPGIERCGAPGLPHCPDGYFCNTGCCSPNPT